MSDLHIDLNHFGRYEENCLLQVLNEKGIDHLHFAGDISNHFYETTLPFMLKLKEHVRITYNLGNHDMLDLSEEAISEADFKCSPLNDTTMLLAFHGWYDYSFFSEMDEAGNLRFKKQFWFDRRIKRPNSDPQITEAICIKLEQILKSNSDKRIIVAMHFVPHQAFLLTYPKLRPFNAFLGSPKFHQIFTKYSVTDVVFGHNHRRIKVQKYDGILYHSRPLGYSKEWRLTNDFLKANPQLISPTAWTPNKRFAAIHKNENFLAYKATHLKEELASAMTIFEID
ncbi:metallophosphoesterase [Streptococcus penaeicida]